MNPFEKSSLSQENSTLNATTESCVGDKTSSNNEGPLKDKGIPRNEIFNDNYETAAVTLPNDHDALYVFDGSTGKNLQPGTPTPEFMILAEEGEEREVTPPPLLKTESLTPSNSMTKELWWTSPSRDAEETDASEYALHCAPTAQLDTSFDEGIESHEAFFTHLSPVRRSRSTQDISKTFPSPQMISSITAESKKENSPPHPILFQSIGCESEEERDPRHISDNGQIEFRHPYPLPPPVPRPRPACDIIKNSLLKAPEAFKLWSQPKPELEKLLLAVQGSSLPRRSNACGAMKVLSMKKKNQLTLVRTRGFLDGLVFAMNADIPLDQDSDIARDARGRAMTTLLNVSVPKDNRVLVLNHPGIASVIVKVIKEDPGEARVHACAALGMLAKTPVNRQLMIKVEGLVDVLAQILSGSIDDEQRPSYEEDDGSEEGTDGFGSSSFSSESASPHGSVNGSVSGSLRGSTHGSVSGSVSVQDDTSIGGSSVSSVRSPPRRRKGGKSIRRQKDEKYNEFLGLARSNSCAALSHLSKHCSISDELADNHVLVDSIVKVCKEFDNPIHTKCIEILCNFSRFPSNTADMARNDALVNTLLKCGKSKTLEDRVWTLRTLQNISSDSTSKVILANSRVLTLLSICAMRKDYDEQVAAVAGLYNLSTEPGAVVPLTNTRNVVATLVHLAHNTVSAPEIREMACDALATIGLWLQTLAGSGKVPDSVNKVLLPSHTTTGWERWD